MKNAIEAMQSRRSIRTYNTGLTVERSTIEEIVDCARLAPTAMNDQPWEFVVVTERSSLAKIPTLLGHAEFIANAAFCVLVFSRESGCALEDCCAATENLLIAAEAHGLGACWVAGTGQPYAPAVAQAFGAPASHQLISLVSVGHPAEQPTIEKRPLMEVLHWERF
ncbi:MAG: nitroreductase family protein [Acidobacteriaceae bacterium]|nr:nitroreductase family protein [Acidobacteriaceae bacterium]